MATSSPSFGECGPDSSFSITPEKLKSLVDECNLSFQASRMNYLKRSDSEQINKQFRRSIYFIKDLPKGHILKKDDINAVENLIEAIEEDDDVQNVYSNAEFLN